MKHLWTGLILDNEEKDPYIPADSVSQEYGLHVISRRYFPQIFEEAPAIRYKVSEREQRGYYFLKSEDLSALDQIINKESGKEGEVNTYSNERPLSVILYYR